MDFFIIANTTMVKKLALFDLNDFFYSSLFVVSKNVYDFFSFNNNQWQVYFFNKIDYVLLHKTRFIGLLFT